MTDLTPAEERTLAWKTLACRTTTCLQPAGRRCITSSGERTSPHAPRIYDIRAYLLGQATAQAENAALTEQLANVKASYEQVVAALSVSDDKLDMAMLRLANLQLDLTHAQADLADYKASHPDAPDPEPTPTLVTKFGACPAKGGESAAAAATVTAKFGKGAAVRQFLSTGVAPRPADASIVHVSWKPTAAQITDDWVTKVTVNLLAGDCVEVFHESDSKVRKGDYTKADLVARKNAFFDAVKRVRPDLLVANTLTGWVMDPGSKLDPEEWAVVKADVLGVDCDGIHPTKLPYTDYTAETKAAVAWLAKYPGYRFFAIPEFGCPLITSVDADGAHRAAYHDQYAALWRSTGKCLFVTLFDYDTIGYTLTTPAEINGWKGNVAP